MASETRTKTATTAEATLTHSGKGNLTNATRQGSQTGSFVWVLKWMEPHLTQAFGAGAVSGADEGGSGGGRSMFAAMA